MPHTGPILHGRYAVVSCHVERPLDDEVWRRFSRLQQRRPGRFAIAALMRPPSAGEDEELWLERAREAQALAPLGLHTHWTAPDHARPTGGDPAALVREQGEWLRAAGLNVEFFCGGGWYIDADVARAVAELGYTDCTATSFRPSYLEPGAAHLQLDEPAWDEVHLRLVECGEQSPYCRRREHLQVRRVALRGPAEQEAQTVLEAISVRHGADERASRPEDAPDLGHEPFWVAQVLEQLASDDDVEALGVELERPVEVGPVRLDPELRRLRERLAVGVDADNVVPLGIGLRQRAVAAAEVEH